jgi:hypothetical protein
MPFPVSGKLKISKDSHYAIIEYGNGECDNLAMPIDGGKTNNFRKLIRSVTKMEFKIELHFFYASLLANYKQHQYLYLDFALL